MSKNIRSRLKDLEDKIVPSQNWFDKAPILYQKHEGRSYYKVQNRWLTEDQTNDAIEAEDEINPTTGFIVYLPVESGNTELVHELKAQLA